MRVYLNHAAQPSLVVPRLQGLRPDGGLAFKGPAIYANLIIDPGSAADLSAVPAASVERGTIMAWRAAPSSVYNRNGAVTARDAPTGDAWSTIEVEPTGLVNLGRVFGLARAPSPSLAWLRTEVTASGPLRRTPAGRFRRRGMGVPQRPARHLRQKPVLSLCKSSVAGRATRTQQPIDFHELAQRTKRDPSAVSNDWRSRSGPLEPSHYGWATQARFNQVEGLDLH